MVVVLVIIPCLVAACLNAVAAILQRQAAGSPKASQLFRRRFIFKMLLDHRWQIGMGLQVVTAALQGVALYFGSLVLIEPLLTTDLVFLLLFLHFRYRVPVGLREWGGVVAICAGLTSLLVAAYPRSGNEVAGTFWWVIVSSIVAGAIIIGAAIMRGSGSSVLRAGVGGVASGLNLALTASFVKLGFHDIAQFGFWDTVTSWVCVGFVVSALLSVVVLQSTFAAGPLVVSQPAIEISTPLTGCLVGVFLLGDVVTTTPAAIVMENIGGIAITAGVILLGGSKRVVQREAASAPVPVI